MSAKSDPYSYLKVFHHADKLAAIRQGQVTPPLYVRIKPINACNHHCYYCSYDDQNLGLRSTFNPKDKLSRELMLGIIRDFTEMKIKAVTFSGGGEPLIYPHIAETMRLMLDGGMDISVITNGHFLSEDRAQALIRAKWVRISMDSCRADRYASIRRIPEKALGQVCDNIRAFARIKSSDCELGINFVVTPENADEVYEMTRFVKDLGANHIKITAVITKDLHDLHAPVREQVTADIHRAQKDFVDGDFKVINKYEFDFDMNAVFQRSYKFCPIQQIITVIGADAKVYLCHDKAYVPGGDLGDLTRQSFKDLWFSEATRRRFQEFDARRECCHHCVYDQRNIMINSFLDLDDSQINFV